MAQRLAPSPPENSVKKHEKLPCAEFRNYFRAFSAAAACLAILLVSTACDGDSANNRVLSESGCITNADCPTDHICDTASGLCASIYGSGDGDTEELTETPEDAEFETNEKDDTFPGDGDDEDYDADQPGDADSDTEADGTAPDGDSSDVDNSDSDPVDADPDDGDGGDEDAADGDVVDAVDVEASDAEPGDPETSDGDVLEADRDDGDAVQETEPDTEPVEEESTDIAEPDEPVETVSRIVIAGDSWSTGIILPTIASLSDRGYTNVAVSYEFTAIAGSRAEEWANNEDNKLEILAVALNMEPPAEILILIIGGNDLNSHIVNDDFGLLPGWWRELIFNDIEDDIQTTVDFALAIRPGLKVVIVGYDYLHYDFLCLYVDFEHMNQHEYNEAFVELGRRKLSIAQRTPNCEYAHNFGLLQYRFGDNIHPPFLLPPAPYAPGAVPFPGVAPAYTPFPGGLTQLPGPLDYLPDGIHPSEVGFRAIIDNSFDQGLSNLVEKRPWY